MKKLYLLLCMVAVVFIFPGCAKKDEGPGYYMKAKLGDKDYYVANCLIYSSGGATIINGFVQTSTAPTYPYVTITLYASLGATGKTKLDKTTGSFAQCFTSSGFARVSESGEVIIKNVSGNAISGSFSFKCIDGTSVTNGTFTAKMM